MLVDDHTVLSFNHPTDSSLAAFTSVEDPNATAQGVQDIEKFDSLILPELSEDQKRIDHFDQELYNKKKQEA